MLRRVAVLLLLVGVACSPGPKSPVAARKTATASVTTPAASPPFDPWAAARALEAPDAPALVARLVATEAALRSPGATDAAVADGARVEQAAYGQLVVRPKWLPLVIARVPASLRAALRANVDAGKALHDISPPLKKLPAWRIVAPRPASELRSYYGQAQAKFRIPWYVLAAVNLVETRMGRIRGLSTAGARGPMQFMPQTWAAYGRGNIDDPHDSILAAGRYLAANGGARDIRHALFRYNHSSLYVRAVVLYAQRMRDDPLAFRAYYHWGVYVATVRGVALLPEGWPS